MAHGHDHTPEEIALEIANYYRDCHFTKVNQPVEGTDYDDSKAHYIKRNTRYHNIKKNKWLSKKALKAQRWRQKTNKNIPDTRGKINKYSPFEDIVVCSPKKAL